MEFIGTKFSITLGAWRLRFVLALEEANDERRPDKLRPHHVTTPRERTAAR
ncbi:MAG: hypothetical protein JO024_09040 [Candidatus Eremiobacteraeota bacterium]|nr:hypothetical protein [Candidatus Eremiobacteraeota bacterium]